MYLKKVNFGVIIILSLLILSCDITDTEHDKTEIKNDLVIEENNNTNNKDFLLNANSEDSTSQSDLKVEVLLKSITVMETDNICVITISGFDESILETFNILEFEYYSSYNTLRILNSQFYKFIGDYILVEYFNVSNIVGNDYIKQWHEALVYGGHSIAYDIVFREPIEYTKEINDDNYSMTINIRKKDINKQYNVRTKSFKGIEICMVHYQIADVLSDYGIQNSFILQDDDGYFVHLNTFESEDEAYSFIEIMNTLIDHSSSEWYGINSENILLVCSSNK